MMTIQECMVHERTLSGAVDSYLGILMRTRPHLAAAFGDVLEEFAHYWLEANRPNQLDAITAGWINAFLVVADDHHLANHALRDFFVWCIRQRLITQNPLAPQPLGILF